jgi:hypothetical protein
MFTPADPEGLTNGLVVADPNLPNGWVHGRKYLGSFTIATTNVNSGANLSSTPGQFEVQTCNLGIAVGQKLTITANYSQDPPGTHNARVLTSLFSPPVTIATSAGPCIFVTTTASTGPGSLHNALGAVTNGAYVSFNIPGAGPHTFKHLRTATQLSPITMSPLTVIPSRCLPEHQSNPCHKQCCAESRPYFNQWERHANLSRCDHVLGIRHPTARLRRR